MLTGTLEPCLGLAMTIQIKCQNCTGAMVGVPGHANQQVCLFEEDVLHTADVGLGAIHALKQCSCTRQLALVLDGCPGTEPTAQAVRTLREITMDWKPFATPSRVQSRMYLAMRATFTASSAASISSSTKNGEG
jgi:hypothetical protein